MSLFHPVLKCTFILYCECPLGLAYYYYYYVIVVVPCAGVLNWRYDAIHGARECQRASIFFLAPL